MYCESVWPVPEVRGVNVACGPDGPPFGVGVTPGLGVGVTPGLGVGGGGVIPPPPPPPQPAMNAPSTNALVKANGSRAGRFKRLVLLPCGAGSIGSILSQRRRDGLSFLFRQEAP